MFAVQRNRNRALVWLSQSIFLYLEPSLSLRSILFPPSFAISLFSCPRSHAQTLQLYLSFSLSVSRFKTVARSPEEHPDSDFGVVQASRVFISVVKLFLVQPFPRVGACIDFGFGFVVEYGRHDVQPGGGGHDCTKRFWYPSD